jgi:hypothetical protein
MKSTNAPILAIVIGLSVGLHPGPAPADTVPLSGAVSNAIEQVIIPDYEALVATSETAVKAMSALCEEPDSERLTRAREAFAPLVMAFSAVEPYRFGPARAKNRFERLFFWPDSRGRGLRQVQGILADKDDTAIDRESLQQKSVAVQGLPALEYLLFGTDSGAIARGDDAFRCRYAQTTAEAIWDVSRQLLNGWNAEDGIAARLRNPADDNPVYRTSEEAMQELLKAVRQQLQATAELKLEVALGDAPDRSKPKTLPFWRSGLALNAIDANLDAVARLIDAWDLPAILDEETTLIAQQLDYELKTAQDAVTRADAIDPDIQAVVKSQEGHSQLAYSRIPMKSVVTLLSEDIAHALGLTVGFNALDGD